MGKKKEITVQKVDGQTETVMAMVMNECWAYASIKLKGSDPSYIIVHHPSGVSLPYVMDSASRCRAIIKKLPCQIEVTEEYITDIKFALAGAEIREGVKLSIPIVRQVPR